MPYKTVDRSDNNTKRERRQHLHDLLSSQAPAIAQPIERLVCEDDFRKLREQMVNNRRHRQTTRELIQKQLDAFQVIPLTTALVPDDDSDDYRPLYIRWLLDYWMDDHSVFDGQLIQVAIDKWFVATAIPDKPSTPLFNNSGRPLTYAVLIPRQVHIFNVSNWNVGLGLNTNTICYLYYYREGNRIRPGTNHTRNIAACPGLIEVLEAEQL